MNASRSPVQAMVCKKKLRHGKMRMGPMRPHPLYFRADYCSSLRISCCTVLDCASALMPVWLRTSNFARSLVA